MLFGESWASDTSESWTQTQKQSSTKEQKSIPTLLTVYTKPRQPKTTVY